jgi:hypothetical protein
VGGARVLYLKGLYMIKASLQPHLTACLYHPPIYSNLENLVLGARLEVNGFVGKDSEMFWSTGVLEYWSVGKS